MVCLALMVSVCFVMRKENDLSAHGIGRFLTATYVCCRASHKTARSWILHGRPPVYPLCFGFLLRWTLCDSNVVVKITCLRMVHDVPRQQLRDCCGTTVVAVH